MEEHNRQTEESFISAYDAHAEAIFRYCVFRIYDRERAKELMQETFTRAWEYVAKGKRIDAIKPFLYRVAHNVCVNEIARRKAYSLDQMKDNIGFDAEDEHAASPHDTAEINLMLSRMRELKPEEQELLTMRYVADLAVSEMAKILKKLPNTVSVRLRRAEESLKQLYDKKNGKQQ